MLAVYQAFDVGRAMGWAGRERVVRHFEINRMVAAYEALYVSNMRCPRLQVCQ